MPCPEIFARIRKIVLLRLSCEHQLEIAEKPAQHFVAAGNFRERTIRLRHARLEGIAVIARAQDCAAEVRNVADERARQINHPTIGIVFGISIESVADKAHSLPSPKHLHMRRN